MDLNKFIEKKQDVRFDKPVIKNTGIAVRDILDMLASGISMDEIIEQLPQLKKEHIFACLQFASDREKFGTNK